MHSQVSKTELSRLETEERGLKKQLSELEKRQKPLERVSDDAKAFIRNWGAPPGWARTTDTRINSPAYFALLRGKNNISTNRPSDLMNLIFGVASIPIHFLSPPLLIQLAILRSVSLHKSI